MRTTAHPELAQDMSVNRLTVTLNDDSQHHERLRAQHDRSRGRGKAWNG
jgi:hypothetical protein